jgi:hypothetical protein
MGIDKPQAPSSRSVGNQVGISELFRQCCAAEPNLTKQNMDKLKLIFAKGFFFDRPLFGPPPTIDESCAIHKGIDLKIREQLWEADKYRCCGFRKF